MKGMEWYMYRKVLQLWIRTYTWRRARGGTEEKGTGTLESLWIAMQEVMDMPYTFEEKEKSDFGWQILE